MTLDGTNTWVLRAGCRSMRRRRPRTGRAAHRAAVLDAGGRPSDPGGRRAAHPRPPRPRRGGAVAFAEAARRRATPVRALDPAYRLGAEGLVRRRHGDRRRASSVPWSHAWAHRGLAVVPAATADGAAAHRRHGARSGHDGGGAPRRSARRLPRVARPTRGLAARRTGPSCCRATGRCSTDPAEVLEAYQRHRQERLDAGRRRRCEAGPRTARAMSSRSSTPTSTRRRGRQRRAQRPSAAGVLCDGVS